MTPVDSGLITAQVQQSGRWVSPTGHVEVVDQPRVYGGAWQQRYGVSVHQPDCDQPGQYGCDCAVTTTQHVHLKEAVAVAVAGARAFDAEEAA